MKYIFAVFFISGFILAQSAFELNKKGVEYSNSGMYQEAIPLLKQALALSTEPVIRSNLKIAYSNLIFKYLKESDYDRALTVISEALVEFEDSSDFYLSKGVALYKKSDYDGARRAFDRSIALNDSAEAHRWLADTYYKQNFVDDALYEYEYLAEKQPNNPDVMYNLGKIYYDQDKLDKARMYFERLITGFPASAYTEQVSALLAKIKKDETVRTDFSQRYGNHFVVKYEGQERKDLATVLIDLLEDVYSEIGQKTGYYPDRELIVILYTGEQYKDVVGAPDWAGAVYDGKIRVPAGSILHSTEATKQVLAHEYTHMCVYYLTDGKCPTWINEGVAQHFAGQNIDSSFLKRLIASDKFISPFKFPPTFMRLDNFTARVAYEISHVYVKYICEKESQYTMLRILEDIKAGKSDKEAVYNWMYLDEEELFRRVSDYIKKEL